MLAACESSVQFMWESLGNTEESYQLWKKQLNDIMHQCFRKKKIQKDKKLFDRETRELMKERKYAKTKLSCKQLSPQSRRNLDRKIGKLDKKINANVAKFHINMVKQKVGQSGVMDRQNFWKLKRVLAPKSLEIPHAIKGGHGNLITDPININDEYRNEFQHRLRKREICDHLSWYESFQNNLCMLQIYASKAKVSPDFTMDELKTDVHELKTGKCTDPLGLIRESFQTFR